MSVAEDSSRYIQDTLNNVGKECILTKQGLSNIIQNTRIKISEMDQTFIKMLADLSIDISSKSTDQSRLDALTNIQFQMITLEDIKFVLNQRDNDKYESILNKYKTKLLTELTTKYNICYMVQQYNTYHEYPLDNLCLIMAECYTQVNYSLQQNWEYIMGSEYKPENIFIHSGGNIFTLLAGVIYTLQYHEGTLPEGPVSRILSKVQHLPITNKINKNILLNHLRSIGDLDMIFITNNKELIQFNINNHIIATQNARTYKQERLFKTQMKKSNKMLSLIKNYDSLSNKGGLSNNDDDVGLSNNDEGVGGGLSNNDDGLDLSNNDEGVGSGLSNNIYTSLNVAQNAAQTAQQNELNQVVLSAAGEVRKHALQTTYKSDKAYEIKDTYIPNKLNALSVHILTDILIKNNNKKNVLFTSKSMDAHPTLVKNNISSYVKPSPRRVVIGGGDTYKITSSIISPINIYLNRIKQQYVNKTSDKINPVPWGECIDLVITSPDPGTVYEHKFNAYINKTPTDDEANTNYKYTLDFLLYELQLMDVTPTLDKVKKRSLRTSFIETLLSSDNKDVYNILLKACYLEIIQNISSKFKRKTINNYENISVTKQRNTKKVKPKEKVKSKASKKLKQKELVKSKTSKKLKQKALVKSKTSKKLKQTEQANIEATQKRNNKLRYTEQLNSRNLRKKKRNN